MNMNRIPSNFLLISLFFQLVPDLIYAYRSIKFKNNKKE